MKTLTISQYSRSLEYRYITNDVLFNILNDYGKDLCIESTTLSFTVNVTRQKALQVKKIMESGHKIKNWSIRMLNFSSKKDGAILDVQVLYTIHDTMSIEYKNFLKFNSK